MSLIKKHWLLYWRTLVYTQLTCIVCMLSSGITHSQSYYNAPIYLASDGTMSDFGDKAIFGSNVQASIEGNINLFSNDVYIDSSSSISGNGNIIFLAPDSTMSPSGIIQKLDANGASVHARITINTSRIVMDNITIAGLTPNANSDILVGSVVNFIEGVVNTGPNIFHFLGSASHTNASQLSHINGYVRKTGNTAFTFPVGTDSVYAPIGISAPALPTDQFTANYIHSNPKTAIGTQLDPTLHHISSCEYWNLDRTNGNSNVNVNLFWDSPRSCGVSAPSKLRAAHWNGTYWEDKGNLGFFGDSISGYLVSDINTSFSPFTLGSTSVVNPLPVSLDYFTATCQEDSVRLEWRTLSELNNAYFQIEYSRDLLHWTPVAHVAGAGSSNQAITYSGTQVSSGRETQYFRLRQVDYDGTETAYAPISASCEEKARPMVYPNPLLGATFNIQAPSSPNAWQYVVGDMNGKPCIQGQFISDGSPYIVDAQNINAGTYYITIRNTSETYTYPLIKITQ